MALGIGNYGAMGIGIIVNILIARRLGTEQYGRLTLMMMVSQVALLVTMNWSHIGFIRFGSEEFASKGALTEALWTRMGIVLPAATLAVILMALARQPLAAYLGVPLAGVWLILLHFVAVGVLAIIGAVFQASDRMAYYGACLFLDKAVVLLSIVVLSVSWTVNPLTVLGCYAASSLSVAIWGMSVVGLQGLRPALPRRSAWRRMVLFSAPLLLSSWVGVFSTNWFDLAILRWYVPISGIGVYSLAAQLAGVVQQPTVIFSTLLLPQLSVMVAEGQDARIKMFLERLLPYWLLATSVLFSLVLLGAREGLPLVFGPSFSGAAPVLALLMVAASMLALFSACGTLVAAYGAMWVLTTITFLFAVTNVVLDLILIPRFGIVGSALATVVAYGLCVVPLLLFLQRKVGGGVLRLGWLGAPVLVGGVCFMLLDGAWFYAVSVAAILVTVLALVSAFRLFHPEDAIFIRQLHLPMPFGLKSFQSQGRRP